MRPTRPLNVVTSAADNGKQYRARFSNSAGSAAAQRRYLDRQQRRPSAHSRATRRLPRDRRPALAPPPNGSPA
ncbi:MAG: hypothetical protein R3E79_46750 [Caldilineaceae bacterium]